MLENAKLNQTSLDFQLVDWRKPTGLKEQDFIIASDILYEPDVYEDLVSFIAKISHSKTQIIIADPERVYSHRFFQMMEKSGFESQSSETRDRIMVKTWTRI